MRSAIGFASLALVYVAFACSDGDQSGGSASDELKGGRPADAAAAPATDGGALACPKGGSTGPIRVVFDCDEVSIESCKDLSNVVLEFEDGSRIRYEGLNGRTGTFSGSGELAGERIVRVWVKAGANHSGDGPGYGQRFEASGNSCDAGGAGGAGGGSGGGAGVAGGGGLSGGPPPIVE